MISQPMPETFADVLLDTSFSMYSFMYYAYSEPLSLPVAHTALFCLHLLFKHRGRI